ncbi:MAG: hypothetical protein U1E56_13140 [Bauldia sp.]
MMTSTAVWPKPEKQSQLKRIRLELARSDTYPNGSSRHGYEFVAPLDSGDHLDADGWRHHRGECVVRRFWGDEEPQIGRLVHRSGGAEHARWVFDYDPEGEEDDEAGYRLGGHLFRVGEYVTIRGEDRKEHTFRVTSVQPRRL